MSLLALGYILAEVDREVRNIFIVVVAVVWIISSIAKAVKRAADQQKTRQDLQITRAEIERNIQKVPQSRPVQLAPDVARRVPPMIPGRTPQPLRKPQTSAKRQKRSQPPRTAVQAAQFADAQVERASVAEVPASIARPATAKQTVQASAPTLQTWLRPATLRQQFILTEIFQPPLALRERRF